MEDAFIIHGGKPLKGKIILSGAKNVSLKVVIAALLFKGKVILHNIPKIEDIFELFHLIKTLGGSGKFIDTNTVSIDSTDLNENRLDFLHASKIRTSFMLFAPLLYRFKKAFIPNPGGCRLGARPIDRIVEGMQKLGVTVTYNSETGYYDASIIKKPEGSYVFQKPSHTGTEFLILMSVFCKGTILIRNAALEPEIDDLIQFLNEGGANITRIGEDIKVVGVDELRQKRPYTIVSDRNEAVTYAVLGIITKGDITIGSIPKNYIQTFISFVKKIGAGVEQVKNDSWRFYYKGDLMATNIITDSHPGFMTDWQPNWAVLMTQANGTSTIHERIFENRFAFVDELVKVGAKIEYYQPKIENPQSYYMFNYDVHKDHKQAIKIYGPQRLHNGVLNIADLRAGATLAIAALLAQGESVINGASILERGYENFIGKVTHLGGDIKKV
ncbi:hypothetical protein A2334_02085 [Candidatus Roizmanbacteria bacterium RIFOXYB2_FULL_38_10]|uniref:UDP-N-acetylglucosamine 1-carboxyvinyltransferase n=1 Tax=Candidatus Roizmanbacteria bacterium RIFOXYD1_FULL_38_12 TaxID=1802093 RepID=A0A1F7L059_9BACT|nr:MAG: hypothetical protein A3K47_01880 [Candidatus Roizmanbacteria bacterium RIFOXYA2_FULL_38_14]OGK63529.1 MAG: hypothetical protein A3K27_01880 [Candidatus Roizmanbacteria bacterium RIFOXYA1_FULL_37_12]OGK65375.1 MAG: hypothetical protein A3K38_01880 [Candidatus Roizmanbacteria bacterium RIFOXYB1_FULL_40_23]OGK67910.1 MAG: hypothetical protein A2334_02085 [Candidatus Roizmanbacteria bacterium RIFOXYB2_FULL_38_10]OGK69780.1 MAG: hypothetical protein A3K21_01885 [Candidatus Roizmanbacteria ba